MRPGDPLTLAELRAVQALVYFGSQEAARVALGISTSAMKKRIHAVRIKTGSAHTTHAVWKLYPLIGDRLVVRHTATLPRRQAG